MNKNFLIIFICLLAFHQYKCCSQKISGYVTSQDKVLKGVSTVVKKRNKIIEFAFSDNEGRFKFNNVYPDSIEIHISHLNYKKQILVFLPKKDTLIVVELFKSDIILGEVVIKKETPIQYKKDTIVYNPAFFKDGTEKVVEDLLKKLPGISVKSNGKIYFKDKEIQSLMLEGDDLFNSQYTIGSKNIDINLVESIEAIDNFNTNKVLHKIIDSDKVALNLKLKKGKTDMSLNTVLENDFFSKYNNVITGIAISSKHKGFSTLALNNIGIVNASNFNFSNNDDASFYKGRNKELLSQGNFPNFLGNNNSLLNNSIYNYTSFGRNVTKKTKTIFGINYYDDNIAQNFVNRTTYKFEEQNFDSFNEEIQTKKPKVFSLNNTTTYYNGNDFQIESKFLFENIENKLRNDLNNNGFLQNSDLTTRALFVAGKSEITKMISTKSAINFIVFLSNNNSKQNFFIEPGLVSLGSSNILNTQQSNINTFCLFSNLEFYKNWSFLKFKISNNLEMQKDHIITYLFDNQTQAINNDFVNNFKFKDVTNQLKFDTSIKRKKFNFGMSINLWYNNLYLDEIITSKKNLLFNLNYKYIIDKKNSLNLLYNEDIKAPTINYLFEKNVVNSYRNIISNQRNLDYVKSRDIRLTYNLSDLFHTFYFNVGTGFSSMNKAYYYINQISAELIYNKAILLDYGNNKMYFDFSVHKLIPFIKTTVKLNSAFSTFSSYNFINNSELRKLKSSTINSELFLYTGFKAKVNFQEKINSESNFYKVNDENNTSLTQIKNEFNITYKISSLINFKMEFQTFIPDRNKKSTFNFLNFEIN